MDIIVKYYLIPLLYHDNQYYIEYVTTLQPLKKLMYLWKLLIHVLVHIIFFSFSNIPFKWIPLLYKWLTFWALTNDYWKCALNVE